MTGTIIIVVSLLLLCAYLFDITAPKTKIPSVILLLLLGWALRKGAGLSGTALPSFTPVLPVLGTVGLILIVLEGALELELRRSRLPLIGSSFFGAVLPLALMALGLASLLQLYTGSAFSQCLLNVLPFCVISSAIAIPSSRNFTPSHREFVIYESSFSDIAGVLLFNYMAAEGAHDLRSAGVFFLQLLIMVLVSFASTIGLSLLLGRLKHHVKFIPIILLVILIYSVAKALHLPALLFILIFGLFIGNLDELNRFEWIRRLHPEKMDREVKRFRDLAVESTFVIRALFFILFGYLIDTAELLDTATLLWALLIVVLLFAVRAVQLKLSRLPFMPLLFMAPRGLITILLFLSIPAELSMPMINRSLVTQVIVLTAMLMMAGSLLSGKEAGEQKAAGSLSEEEDSANQR